MKTKRLFAFFLLLCTVCALSAQNMNRYITLTSFKGESCFLVFDAGKTNPVKVVNGSTSKTFTDTESFFDFVFEDAVVTVYGDVTTLQVHGTLDAIDLSHNNILGSLRCLGSSLYTLNLKNCTALQTLYCSSNHLSSLDVSNNTALTHLDCSSNELSSLDVSNNTALAHLDCSSNELSSLNVSNNTALAHLDCSSNHLSSLDVSNNTALTHLACSTNLLSSLDVSNNTALTHLDCSSSYYLSSLDVSKNTALTYLDCSSNGISSLDVSKNTALTHLKCSFDHLSSLDVSKNTALTYLDCSSNELLFSSLDVSKNTALTHLDCGYNYLYSLDVSKNTALTHLDCSSNELSSLDVSKNISLTLLKCSYNSIQTLDVSNNKALNYLSCAENAFGVAEYDNIMCDLPVRTGEAIFHPLYAHTDANYAIFMASNSKIASAKGWTVSYNYDDKPIPATQGKYMCPVDMDLYVKMGVKQGREITLSLAARAGSVATRIVCGSLDTTLVIGSSSNKFKFVAPADEVTVYGNLFEFSCNDNGSKITSLDASNNAMLTRLSCENNTLTSLDMHKNSGLRVLAFNGNPFTAEAFDELMCSLPDVTEAGGGVITPLKDSLDENYAVFMDANSSNALEKGWNVMYRKVLRDIPATSGKFDCVALSVREATTASSLLIRPNPARTELNISNAEGEVRVYDIAGRVVWRSEPAGPEEIVLNVAGWAKGMYFVRSGRHTLKFVKE